MTSGTYYYAGKVWSEYRRIQHLREDMYKVDVIVVHTQTNMIKIICWGAEWIIPTGYTPEFGWQKIDETLFNRMVWEFLNGN